MESNDLYKANLNFKRDYADLCIEELNAAGYSVTVTDPFDIVIQYNNYQSRLPSLHKRNILKASTFSSSTDQDSALSDIELKFKNGETLKPYLSRKITDLGYNDPLLNDWGIYHFHLGTVIEADGFIERSGPLLFAYVNNENAYFLAVGNHNSWTDQGLIEILHRDFPESIEIFKSDIIPVDGAYSSDDIKILRPRVNYMLTLSDGTVYHSIGGGVMTSGVGVNVAVGAGYHLRMVTHYEDKVRENLGVIVDIVKNKLPKGELILDIKFIGWQGDLNKPVILEQKSRMQIGIESII